MADPIHRTIFQIEVFSRGPFVTQDVGQGPDDPFDLKAIDYAITEGDCIGMVEEISSVEVAPDQVGAHLLRIGNDGSFFDDEEIGG